MNTILAGLDKLLLQFTVAFLLVGTAYLFLSSLSTDEPSKLPPQQVAENLTPIGHVRLARVPEAATESDAPDTSAAENAPDTPAPRAAQTAATPTLGVAAPIETLAASVAVEEPAVKPIEPFPELAKPEPASSEASMQQSYTSEAQANGPVAPYSIIELKPDRNGMHGTYRITPEGITLRPTGMEHSDVSMDSLGGISGSFRVTPDGDAYFQPKPHNPIGMSGQTGQQRH
ncbi:MAG: hypothetical protein WBG92_20060 [Thiohalocapsa sp.]